METLNQYEIRMTLKLVALPLNKWYKINPEREDYDAFMMTLNSRQFAFGDFEFRNNNSEFRRIKERDQYDAKNYTGQITYTIEWRKQEEVEFDYSHLPPPKFTPENKIIKRRSV